MNVTSKYSIHPISKNSKSQIQSTKFQTSTNI